jgi:paraquat-inducible protein A
MTHVSSQLSVGRSAGLALCGGCLAINQIGTESRCARCGTKIEARVPRSLERTTAYLVAAAILYVPANALPVMHTSSLLLEQDDTILSGVLFLLRSGSWPLALLVFVASIMVPLLKILALAVLVWLTARGSTAHLVARTRLYRVVEFIGRWSLLDIYAVTLLVGVVQMGRVATIVPGPGALAFAAVVVLTLLAARSFDPRSAWDALEIQRHE